MKIGFDMGVKTTDLDMALRIPEVSVKSNGKWITRLSQLLAGDTFTARLEDIAECTEGEDAYVIIAQYSDKRLMEAKMAEVYEGCNFAELSADMKNDTDCIKVMYWSKNTQMPLIGEFVLE